MHDSPQGATDDFLLLLPEPWQKWLSRTDPSGLWRATLLDISANLKKERDAGHILHPSSGLIFSAFECQPSDTRVVILGQDPYHQPGQATGMAFSVPDGVRIPPSLRNIFREIAESGAGQMLTSGNLSHWRDQGVLLLNTALTVRESEPLSHAHIGWSAFVKMVLRSLAELDHEVQFLLWGRHARSFRPFIEQLPNARILEAGHPSPLSARYFLGCGHFRLVNDFLVKKNQQKITWS